MQHISADLFQRSPALLALATADGTLTRVNPAWAEALGRHPEDLADCPLADIVHPEDRADVARSLSCGGGGEQRFAHADGSWSVLRWRARSTEHGDGLHLAACDVTTDRRELNALTSAVAHDLRAPLRAIDGFSRVLLTDEHGSLPDETARFLALVRESGSELAALLDGLVRVMQVGRAPFAPEDADVARVVTEVIDLVLRPRQGARDVTWVVGELPNCRADVPLLRRVLEELLGNALAFTAPNASARIEVAFDAGEQAYVVRDDGVGFDDALADRAFAIFGRAHPREAFAGTGVGLAIAGRIVARHGGRIWARSRPGEGADLFFTIA